MQFATYPSLKDKTVFVTGGASGIGAEIVTAFAAQGARVGFLDLDADGSAALVEATTGEIAFEICDLRDIPAMQDALGRQVLIENPSTYVTFSESTWEEGAFMAELAKRSGCGLLFDVNNVYVSATNHKTSAEAYIDAYPLHLVSEIHLAGHAEDADDNGERLLIDAHDRPVHADVWTLYDRVLAHTGALPSLIEWDNDVPDWPVLAAEAARADAALAKIAQ